LIHARSPISWEASHELRQNEWEASCWPACAGDAEPWMRHAGHEVWSQLRGAGLRALPSGCGLVLTERTVLKPGVCAFSPGELRWLGNRDYPRGVPELVVEVPTPATLAEDLPGGRRADVYAAAGVPHYWLVHPQQETLSVFALEGGRYALRGVYRPGDRYRPPFPAGLEMIVADLFRDGAYRGGLFVVGEGWKESDFLAPEEPVGLENLLLVGHPQRRHEVLDDVAPCVVAFTDPEIARRNYARWCAEAARLQGLPEPARLGETFEAGRFRLWRDERRVHAEVRLLGRRFRRVLEVWSAAAAWSW